MHAIVSETQAQIMTESKLWRSTRPEQKFRPGASPPVQKFRPELLFCSASFSARQLETIKWRSGLPLWHSLYWAHKHLIYISTVPHWICHLFNCIIMYYFTPKWKLFLAVLFSQSYCFHRLSKKRRAETAEYTFLHPYFLFTAFVFFCGAFFWSKCILKTFLSIFVHVLKHIKN